jgi:hypothetical protein
MKREPLYIYKSQAPAFSSQLISFSMLAGTIWLVFQMLG